MRVRYAETALAEIDEILSWIAEDNPAAALKVAVAIERSVAWIARRPETSPIVHGESVRAKLVLGYQFRVFYEAGEGEIIIRNVRSTRRLRPWEG